MSFDKRNPGWKSCQQIKKWIYFDHRQHWQKEALPSKIHQKCFLCLFTCRCYEIDGMTNERCKYLVWWCSSSPNDKITTIDKNKNILALTCYICFKFWCLMNIINMTAWIICLWTLLQLLCENNIRFLPPIMNYIKSLVFNWEWKSLSSLDFLGISWNSYESWNFLVILGTSGIS